MSKLPLFRVIEGHKFPCLFREENVRSVLNYSPGSNDVFIATYPKCGTTWMQQIVYLIFTRGEPPRNSKELAERCPFIEFGGQETIKNIRRPGAFKTHLAFDAVPYSEKAKYIAVTRNPKDCCVSYFHHSLGLYKDICGDFDFHEYFEWFMDGQVQYGDYFDHLLGWYKHRNDSNVLFMTYEEMKMDRKKSVLRVAHFLGQEYHDELVKDADYLKKVIDYSDVQYMKKSINDSMREYLGGECVTSSGRKSSEFEKYNIIRKGIVGDWKVHLNEEQTARINKKIEEKLGGTELYQFWKEIGCL